MMTSCLVCGSTQITSLTPFGDENFQVQHCNGCEYETIRPLPSVAALQEYYAGYGTTKTNDAELQFLLERCAKFLEYLVGNEKFALDRKWIAELNYLEIGFGNGASLFAAAQAGFRTFGIDLDESSVLQARARAPQFRADIDCATSDIHEFRKDIPLHVVKASQVIEHTLDPVEFLKDIYDRQPAGGYLVLECPNNNAAFWRVKNMLRKPFNRMNYYNSLKIKEHLSGFTAGNLVLLLEKAGYTVVYCRDYSLRDSLYQPETLLWYPTLRMGIWNSLRWKTPYPFLRSLIPPFDKAASVLARSGTHLAVCAKKVGSSGNRVGDFGAV